MAADFPIKYPEKTLTMSKVEFYQWAVNENKQAKESWIKEFNKGYQYIYASKQVEISDTSGFNSGTSFISIGNNPSKSSSITKKTKRTVPYRYKNPDFKHPGPLTLINPYVQPKKK